MGFIFFGLILLGLAGVYFGVISFPLFMLLILLLTGIIWLVDSLFFQKKRAIGAEEPTAVEYAKSFFPVILVVFLIRSFIAEPFKIPSGSMMPTLLAGDYILVNKFTYGLRIPILNDVLIDINEPDHGDVIVFHFPPNPKLDYIKRVVGLPGDVIEYQEKQLVVNGKPISQAKKGDYRYLDDKQHEIKATHYEEQLFDAAHDILTIDRFTPYEMGMPGHKLMNGKSITVPEGHYFVMGDNRDNSSDGRVWGFVPNENLVGKAFFIWFNFEDFGRIGSSID